MAKNPYSSDARMFKSSKSIKQKLMYIPESEKPFYDEEEKTWVVIYADGTKGQEFNTKREANKFAVDIYSANLKSNKKTPKYKKGYPKAQNVGVKID